MNPQESHSTATPPVPVTGGDWTFLLKVLALSLVMALAIKFGAPRLPIGATNLNATIAILTPSLVLAVIFLVRSLKS
jgi:hypothetical protein